MIRSNRTAPGIIVIYIFHVYVSIMYCIYIKRDSPYSFIMLTLICLPFGSRYFSLAILLAEVLHVVASHSRYLKLLFLEKVNEK